MHTWRRDDRVDGERRDRRRRARDGRRRDLRSWSGRGRGRHDRRIRSRSGRRQRRWRDRRRSGASSRHDERRQRVVGRRGDRCGALRSSRRQEAGWIEVPLFVRVEPDAEMDVRLAHLGVAARSDCPDAVAFGDCRALLNGDRPEVGERHVVPVGRLDRDRLAARRHRARERHDSRSRSEHRRTRIAADVEAAMLPRRVRLRAVEGERLEHRAVGRPRPRARRGCENERDREHEQESSHGTSPLEPVEGTSVCPP